MKQNKWITLFAAFLLPCQSFDVLEKRVNEVSEPLFVELFREVNTLKQRLVTQKTDISTRLSWNDDDQKCLEKTELLQKKLFDGRLTVADQKGFMSVMAQYLIQQEKLNEAEDYLKRVIKLHPTSVEGNYYLAQIYKSKTDKIAEREKHLKRVLVERSVQPFEAELQLDVLRQLVMEFTFDPLETQKWLDLWIQKDPNAPELWLKRAEISHSLKDGFKLDETLGHLPDGIKKYYAAKAAIFKSSMDLAEENATAYINQSENDSSKDLELRKWLVNRLIVRKVFRSARTMAEKSLLKYPADSELLKGFVSAIMGGALDEDNPVRDLETALSNAPDSFELLRKLLDELLKSSRPSLGTYQFPDVPVVKQAEGVIRRLESLKAEDLKSLADVQTWKISILFGKKIYSEADALFNNLEQSLGTGKKNLFQEPGLLKEYDFWILGAKIKKARGLFQEAKDLLQKGLTRARTAEDRQVLLKALAS